MQFFIDKEKYLDTGLVDEKTHPTARLLLYNYTPVCQFSRAWDAVTKMCRGLIVHADTREIVARPFGKFFNYEEHVTHFLAQGLRYQCAEGYIPKSRVCNARRQALPANHLENGATSWLGHFPKRY